MIKFITVWYLIVVPYNHVHSGESMTTIQIPYATQAICEAQADKYRVDNTYIGGKNQNRHRFFSADGLINAHCQFGQVPVYVGEKK